MDSGSIEARAREIEPVADVALVEETAERTGAAVERARAAAATRISEERYSTLFNSIDQGVAVVEVLYDESGDANDLRFIAANRVWEKQNGVTNPVGKKTSEVLPFLELSCVRRYGKVAETGESVRFECHVPDMGLWLDISASRVGGEGSRVVSIVFNDITERKRTEVVLRASEERQAYLLKLSDALRSLSDPAEIQGTASRLLGEELKTDCTLYGEIDEALGYLEVVRDYSRGDTPSLTGRYAISAFSWIGPSSRTGKPTVVNDVRTTPLIPEADRAPVIEQHIEAFIASALIKEGRLVANLCTTSRSPRVWTDFEVALVQETADRTWAAVERARAEAARRKSEEKYRSLFNLIDQGFAVMEVLYDENGAPYNLRFIESNPAFEQRLGLTNPVGKTSRELLPHLEDSCLQAYGGVVETGESIRFESYSQEFERWLDIFASRVGGAGSRLVSVLFDDITERKRAEAALRASEEKYRTLFDSIDQGYMMIEMLYDESGEPTDFRLVEANRVFEKQTGLTNCVGKSRRELFPVTPEDPWLEEYVRVVKTGEPVRREGYSEGLKRWFDFYASRVGGEGSRLVNVVFDDITERKQEEAARRESEERKTYLLKLSDALRSLQDPVEIQETASRMLGDVLKTDRTFYAEVDDNEWGYLLIAQEHVRDNAPSVAGRYPIEICSWIKPTTGSGQPTVVNDVRTSPAIPDIDRAAVSERHVGAFIAVPLIKQGRLVAALCVSDLEPRDWKEADVALVQETGERTWAAVQRAKVEAALSASEEKYRTLFDWIDQGYAVLEVVYDANGAPSDLRFIDTNHVFEKQTGLKDHIGKTARELNPALESSWVETYARVVETGQPARFERYVREIGLWFSVYASRVGQAGSRQVNVVFDDITERRQAEDALRRTQEMQAYKLKLSDALRPLWDPVQIQDTATRLLGKRLQADRILLVEVDEELGQFVIERDVAREGEGSIAGRYSVADYPWIMLAGRMERPAVVDDVGTASLIPESYRAAIAAAQVGAFIGVPLIKDGRLVAALAVTDRSPRHWTEDEVELAWHTGERTWAAILRERAEKALRESEERFRMLVENVREYALVQCNTELRITSWNPGAERIFGYSSEEALGKTFALLLSPEDRATGVPCMKISDMEKVGRHEDARWLVHKDGHRIWTRWVSEPIRNKDGLVTGLAKVLRDETERLKTETSLRQSEKLAVVGRMASSIAHEINNPLEAVTNLIFLARRGGVSPEVGEFLEEAERELARVSHITTATLQFHRQATEPHEVDIEQIVESVLVLHEGRLKSQQIVTERRYGWHPSIVCHGNEVRQVLANLVSNGIDAMTKNTDARRMIVRVKRGVDPKTGEEGVRVMIADTGAGIRESARKHVFEPFFTTKSTTGTGLGLWISAETVQRHQGSLRFRSRTEGKHHGTVFSLFLKSLRSEVVGKECIVHNS